jgi:hypothetical protein
LPVPDGVISQTFASDEYIFFKENLWNLAAAKLDVDNLVFLDSDVFFKDHQWLENTERTLNEFDFVQPFSMCHWLSKSGEIEMSRPDSCTAILQGLHPKGGDYHPGFGMAMTKRLYDYMGGVWDGGVCGGGGDGANVFAHSRSAGTDKYLAKLADRKHFSGMTMEDHRRFFYSPSWKTYRQRSMDYGVRVGHVPNQDVYHRWHGERHKRRYTTRAEFFNWPADGHPPVRYRQDGLQEWTIPQPRAADYFYGRDEDGENPVKASRYIPVD